MRPDARAAVRGAGRAGRGTVHVSATPRLPRSGKPTASSSSKYLPRTYRDSFLFTGPRTPDARTDDSYHCAVKERAA